MTRSTKSKDKVSQRQTITTNYNSNNFGPGRTQSLYHNAGASTSHRQPVNVTNPEDVLLASKRDTPDVSGNIKDMSFDNIFLTNAIPQNWYSEKISF